jgi:hypothetical protein
MSDMSKMTARVDVVSDRLTVTFTRRGRIVDMWGLAEPDASVEVLAKRARLRIRQLGAERLHRAGPEVLT